MINLILGDCLEQMKTLADNSVDSIVSDPPYGISFMAKRWDYDVPKVEVWKEAMRVLKPGGHALIACGTRTQHRMVCNIEDAGFEIRDVVSWIYGSGFPKSLNISKAIDKAAGAEREVVSTEKTPFKIKDDHAFDSSRQRLVDEDGYRTKEITAPATEAAKQWDGWGTALKPACEFFTLCRKPLSEKTVAANALKWGTGGINIDGCRVGTEKMGGYEKSAGGMLSPSKQRESGYRPNWDREDKPYIVNKATGRFPANLIHDGSQEVLGLFPETGDKSAARFFYCPKASKKDRDEGCESLDDKFRACLGGSDRETHEILDDVSERFRTKPAKNNHPTVKPTALMQYLCRLITPPGGIVLDPYMGSGSTGKAAIREGFSFIGVELDPDYYKIAQGRVRL